MTADKIVPSQRLRALLPAGVVAYETNDFVHAPQLYEEERLAVRGAVAKRVEEFAAGRLCARKALAELGFDRFPLLVGSDRRPIWPKSLLGSITHTQGYCGVAVASSTKFSGIGVDAQNIAPLDDKVLRLICTEEELDGLADLSGEQREEAATIIFSAKEAFYKCQYCVTGTAIDFHDVELRVAPGEFAVQLREGLALALNRSWPLQGRYSVSSGIVFSAFALPAR